MKKIVFFSVFLLCTLHFYSQFNIGSNTQNPYAVLQLQGADSSQGFIVPYVTIANRPSPSDTTQGMLIYNLNDSVLQYCNGAQWINVPAANDNDWVLDGDTLYSAPDSSVVIKGGNVGIGTSDPQQLLHIQGGHIRLQGTSSDFDILTAAGDFAARLATTSGGTGRMYLYNESGVLSVKLDGQTSVSNYINSGKLGIGTTSPEGTLHVTGNDPQVYLEDTDGRKFYWQSVGNIMRFYDQTAGGATTLMSIDGSTGFVGIPTTAPTHLLHVKTTSDPVRIEGLQNNASLDTVVTIDVSGVLHKTASTDLSAANDNDWTLDGDTLYSAPDSAVVIRNGNVGIGTLFPNAKLQIDAGNNRWRFSSGSIATVVSTVGGSTGIQLTDNANAILELRSTSAMGNTFRLISNSTGNLLFREGSTDRLIIEGTSGNVAIGATAASQKFHIQNDVSGSDSTFVVTSAGNVGVGHVSPYAKMVLKSAGAGSLGFMIEESTSPSYSLHLFEGASGQGAISWYDGNGAITNRIQGTGLSYLTAGNVGIGTTLPEKQLHVTANTDPLKLQGVANDISIDTVLTIEYTGVVHKRSIASIADSIASQVEDHDWYEEGTTSAPNAIGDNIFTNGRVGIGTASPQFKLEVDGLIATTYASNNTRVLMGKQSANTTDAIQIDIDTNYSGGWARELAFNKGTKQASIGYLSGSGIYLTTGTGTYTTPHVMINPSGDLTIREGDLGVGTNNPGAKFHVHNDATGSDSAFVVTAAGRVGVGTTGPVARLNVVTQNESVDVAIDDASGTISYLQMRHSGTGFGGTSDGLTIGMNSTSAVFHNREAGPISLGTSDQLRMQITAAGNVAIGNNVPQALFHVTNDESGSDSAFVVTASGRVGIGTTNPFNKLHVEGDLNGGAFAQLNNTFTGGPDQRATVIYKNVDQSFEVGLNPAGNSADLWGIYSQTSTKLGLAVHAGGNVGIGTTSGTNQLVVSASSDPVKLEGLQNDASLDTVLTVDNTGVLHKTANSDLTTSIAWSLTGNSGTTAGTNFIGTTDAQDFVIKTNSTERIRVGTNGTNIFRSNIQIGEAGFGARKLKIYDTAGNNQLDIRSTAGNDFVIDLEGTNNKGDLGITQFNVGIGTENPAEIFHIHNDVSGSDSAFVVTSAGNVGVGTTSPSASLQIDAPSASSTALSVLEGKTVLQNTVAAFNSSYIPLQVQNSGNGGAAMTLASPNATGNYQLSRIYYYSGRGDEAQAFAFMEGLNSPETRMVIDAGGNVGIGGFGIGLSGPQAKLQVNRENAGTDSTFVVTAAGNVGIGTTSPSEKLHIEGSLKMADGNEANGFIMLSDANGVASWVDPSTITAADDGDWVLDSDTLYSAPDSTVVIKGGNVGINTTEPLARFYVRNDAVTPRPFVVTNTGNVGVNTGSPTAQLHVGFNGSNHPEVKTVAQGAFTAMLSAIGGPTGSSRLRLGDTDQENQAGIYYYHSSDYMSFVVNGVSDVININSDGNVGLNTSSPSAKFHIHNDASGNDSAFVVTNRGYVGIGTTNPIQKLYVNGSTLVEDTIILEAPGSPLGRDAVRIYRSSGDKGVIELFRDGVSRIKLDANNDSYIAPMGFGTNLGIGTTSPSAKFHIHNDVSGSDSAFVVTAAGNVGVGKTNPASKLDVLGGTIRAGLASGQTTFVGADGSNVGYIGTVQAIPLQIRPGGSSIVSFDNNGNIGFGSNFNNTTKPEEIVHINAGNDSLQIDNLASGSLDNVLMHDPTTGKVVTGTIASVNAYNITSISSTTTIGSSVDVVFCDASGAGFTVTLPTAVGNDGKQIKIKKAESSTNVVVVDGNGTETIDGSATKSLNTGWQQVVLISDGSNWYIF